MFLRRKEEEGVWKIRENSLFASFEEEEGSKREVCQGAFSFIFKIEKHSYSENRR